MATNRTRTISTRVTEAEYQVFKQLAGRMRIAEWARGVLWRESRHAAPHLEAIAAELLALRYIVVNALPAPQEMDTFIKEADETKAAHARALLDGAK